MALQSTRSRGQPNTVFDSLFAFFFKYSPYVFQQGEFRLALSSPVYIAVVAGGRRGACHDPDLSKRTRRREPARSHRAHRAAAVPGRPGAVLPVPAGADSSRGGAAAELPRHPAGRFAQHAGGRHEGKPRGEFVSSDVRRRTARCMKALSSRYAVRVFRFSSSADRVGSAARPDIQRHADAGSAKRSSARRTSSPDCRWPGS